MSKGDRCNPNIENTRIPIELLKKKLYKAEESFKLVEAQLKQRSKHTRILKLNMTSVLIILDDQLLTTQAKTLTTSQIVDMYKAKKNEDPVEKPIFLHS